MLEAAAAEGRRGFDGCRLSAELRAALHVDFVREGFDNLIRAVEQLAAWRLLLQLEQPILALFGKREHAPREVANLINHFIGVMREGVPPANAARFAARTLALLLVAYGAMLFQQTAALPVDTPARMLRDVAVFEELIGHFCVGAPTPSRVRCERTLALLLRLQSVIAALLGERGAPNIAEAAEAVADARAMDPGFSAALRARLAERCHLSRQHAAALEAAIGGDRGTDAAMRTSIEDEPLTLFAAAERAVAMGRSFLLHEWLTAGSYLFRDYCT
jgi:hypothetical protein